MTTQHTPEPPWHLEAWQFSRLEDGRLCLILSEDEYNHARACVNACAGISTDDLEDHGTGGLKHWMDDADETLKAVCVALDDVEYLGRCEQGIYVLKQQRDELQAKCDELLFVMERARDLIELVEIPWDAERLLDEAIAKVRRQQ